MPAAAAISLMETLEKPDFEKSRIATFNIFCLELLFSTLKPIYQSIGYFVIFDDDCQD